MSVLDPSNAPAPSVESSDEASRPSPANGMLGWRVLAILQFAAAGSLVFALASHVFFPRGLRCALLRDAPARGFSGLHATVSVAYQLPLTQRRLCKTRSRLALKAECLAAKVSRDDRSQSFSFLAAARDPRAPPC
jgi:hypothetical protein